MSAEAIHQDTVSSLPEVHYAGFWIRSAATLIDSVLITLIILPLLFWIYGIEYFRPDAPLAKGVADVLLNYVPPLAAAALFWFYRAATPGKMLLSLRIVDAETLGRLSFKQCLVRSLAYLVSMLPLFLGFIWIAYNRRKQGWHDKLAGTVVVYTRA